MQSANQMSTGPSFNMATWKCWFDIGRDVETYSLHEFGHFAGYLRHSSDGATIMYPYLLDCQRNPGGHDIYSMNTQYGYQHYRGRK